MKKKNHPKKIPNKSVISIFNFFSIFRRGSSDAYVEGRLNYSYTVEDEILVTNRNKNYKSNFQNWNTKKLRHLSTRDVVSCIDNLHVELDQPWLHFAFIGDSRIRQQFFNLLKV